MLLPVALRVLLHMLGCCQSTALLQNAFATQRALVYKVKKQKREKDSCRMSPVVLAVPYSPFYNCAVTNAWLAESLGH